MAKLRAALANQQHSAAKAAAKKRSLQNEENKKASVKASLSGSKKGLKKQKAKDSLKASLAQKDVSPSSSSNINYRPSSSALTKQESKSKIHPNPNRRSVVPFDKTDSILLIGEGNFSFSLSLLYPPHNIPGSQILATAYDTQETTYKKYPDSEAIVQELRSKGVKVEFGVDATCLEKSKVLGKGRRWSRVIFNFPHVGAGITDQDRNILTNQHMVLRFLRSVEPFLTDGPPESSISNQSKNQTKSKSVQAKKKKRKSSGSDSDDDREQMEEEEEESPYIFDGNDDEQFNALESSSSTARASGSKKEMIIPQNRQGSILITLLTCPPYSLWSLSKLATKPPTLCPGTRLLQPRYELKRSFDFDATLYEKYEHRRTIGWKDGLSKGKNEEILRANGKARTWEFVRKMKPDDQDD
ncbi:uncharacterized protein I303_107395 [Kwoniella dejecticola CBS 10117]|uniref:25S rRNA (uridine-N(3))-methyltransferase BMT5-like domain-containing protein n=1 Tax=Kwoniella dejecticola CBS 10117 TaxID=1296121 RepID=A0A1A5ZZL0_9TREE|nr:uncharacterized protein I303_06799 [Kwoniella dejecticola CBS 10117]OBR83238.1 hypothetical protein I303_06799 [Kwoniella dejecticola CBS 10117]